MLSLPLGSFWRFIELILTTDLRLVESMDGCKATVKTCTIRLDKSRASELIMAKQHIKPFQTSMLNHPCLGFDMSLCIPLDVVLVYYVIIIPLAALAIVCLSQDRIKQLCVSCMPLFYLRWGPRGNALQGTIPHYVMKYIQ